MDIAAVFLALLALVVGGAVGFLFAQNRGAATTSTAAAEVGVLTSRLEAMTTALAESRADADRVLEQVRADGAARVEEARSEGATRVGEAERRAVRALAEAEDRHAGTVESLEQRHAEAVVALRAEADKRVGELRADTKRLADEFDALSKKALAANAETFLAQAEERLKRTQVEGAAELAKREEAVKQLVEPLTRTLTDVKSEMSAAEKSRLAAHSALAEQVKGMQESSEMLRSETGQLVTALRAPQVRGRWGEIQLRRVVESAGMLEHVDFEEQAQLDGGALRPDLVVTLPGEKQVVVDSKVAFSGYLEAMEAKDEATRNNRLVAHARHLRTHIDQLGAKEYWSHLDTSPEFTVMFVPAEVFLNAALEKDPDLLEHAFAKNVVIATPTTLVALLRTVAYTWRQEKLAYEAQQVFTVGRELHKRLAIFGGHLEQLAKKLNGTVEQFNKMTASLDSRVVPQARKFSALQGIETATLEIPPPLEVLAVPAQKSDLYRVEADDDAPAALPAAHRGESDRAGEITSGPAPASAHPAARKPRKVAVTDELTAVLGAPLGRGGVSDDDLFADLAGGGEQPDTEQQRREA